MSGYFDSAATTQVDERVRDAMLPALEELYGNPSSHHGLGFKAERAVEEARDAVARLMDCDRDCIVFTSGGTEANNTVMFGVAEAKKRTGNRLVTSSVEHSSILASGAELKRRGCDVVTALPEQLPGLVDENTVLVSCMRANNETGAVYPVKEMFTALKKKYPALTLHSDCVQAFGKLPLGLRRSPLDLASVSAHKIHGPKGVGALFIRKGTRITPLLFGGEQQGRRRPGTESVPLILGFGEAARIAAAEMEQNRVHAAQLRGRLLDQIRALPGFVLNSPEDALPNVLNFSLVGKGIVAENLLRELSGRELYLSAGSACAKGKPSHVMEALGFAHERAVGALRVSFCKYNTPEDVDRLAAALADAVHRFTRA